MKKLKLNVIVVTIFFLIQNNLSAQVPNWIYNETQNGAGFGFSVSDAGDVNGDGYSDVIVGAPFFDNGQTDEGKASLFYGSANGISSTPNWIYESNQAGANLGYSVSAAGDVNGDGFDDVIIGAYKYSNGQYQEGIVYVFYGSSIGLQSSPNWTGQVNLAGANFGVSVSSAGDVNDDGYSDVIIGSNGESAYLYKGSSSGLSSSPDWSVNQSGSGYYGFSVSTAGDVNGDGYSDILVGSSIGAYAGNSVWLYLGSPTGPSITHDWLVHGDNAGLFGYSVSSAGDVNNDGYSDILVGAPHYPSGPNGPGKGYLYFGSSTLPSSSPDWTYTEPGTGQFGTSVSYAGDYNGDGYSDIIVGSVYLNKADLFLGSKSGVSTFPSKTFTQVTGQFGNSVSTAGDVNGDGLDDVIVGAYNVSDPGYACSFYGSTFIQTTYHDLVLNGETSGDRFGAPVCNAGDVNGDGFSDLIVGSHFYNGQIGKAYIYLGGPNMNNIPDIIFNGNPSELNFGYSAGTAGDLNNDGYGDVIISAYRSPGKAYIYFGGSSMDNIADVILGTEYPGIYYGWFVTTAGDINGDGFSDVMVSAPGNYDIGSAYIYFGGTNMNSVVDVFITGIPSAYNTSMRANTAGDVNGDGYSDVIIGSAQVNSGPGNAYIYFGGPNMDIIADLTLTGEEYNSYFGQSIASAGDVNGDGYGDVIVGGARYDSYRGSAYIFYGGQSMNNVADVKMVGESYNSAYGILCNSAGDINGDGYSDVIVGATNINSSTGKVYIYYGGSSMNSSIDIIYSGESSSNYFGGGLSSVDLNGDGFSDYMIGANGYDNNKGRVYIKFSPLLYTSISTKIIMEGIYDSTLNRLNLRDTVKAYLCNPASPYQIIDSAIAVTDSMNFISKFKFYNTSSGTYYLKINHRNSIETWSKSGGESINAGAVNNYDFTTSSSQAYGSNQILKGNKYCIYSGDVNQDGAIDLTDMSLIDNDAAVYTPGYNVTDLNGDYIVDLSDMEIANNNSANFVAVIRP